MTFFFVFFLYFSLPQATKFFRCFFSLPYLKMSATAQSAVTKTVFRKFIDSPAGPKTIHFWAPAMKWVSSVLHNDEGRVLLIF
jgi:hypothetical protein